jgi:hypothetical protein
VKKRNPLDAAVIAVTTAALTFMLIVALPEIVAALSAVAVGSTIGGIAVSALLAVFATAALQHLQEIGEVLLGSERTMAERGAALLELIAFAYFIAASGEAVQPGSTLLSEVRSVIGQNLTRIKRIVNDVSSTPASNGIEISGGWTGSRGTTYFGGFDAATGKLHLGKDGHFGGMQSAGGTPIPSSTPGITVFETQADVIWANDSLSLPRAMTSQEAAQIQTALEAAFPGKKVSQVPHVR